MAGFVSASGKSLQMHEAGHDKEGQPNSIVVATVQEKEEEEEDGEEAAEGQELEDEHNKNNKATSDKQATTETSKQTRQTAANNSGVIYDVEHLATFSTGCNGDNPLTTNAPDTSASSKANLPVGQKLSQLQSATSSSSSINETTTSGVAIAEPRVALQNLFEMEKLRGIWTQRMQIKLSDDLMLIVDCETNATVERFHRNCVTKPEAFSQYNDIYNNIIVFIIHQISSSDAKQSDPPKDTNQQQTLEPTGELHIFQCVSHKAQQLVADILRWKSSTSGPETSAERTTTTTTTTMTENNKKQQEPHEDLRKSKPEEWNEFQKTSPTDGSKSATSGPGGQSNGGPAATSKPVVVTVASSASNNETVPIVNVNVKETVQVFNQIAALREKGKANSPTSATNGHQPSGQRPLSDASIGSSQSTSGPPAAAQGASGAGGPLASTGQLYKQRSIRAILAPTAIKSGDKTTTDPPAARSSSPSVASSLEMVPTTSTTTATTTTTTTTGTANSSDNQKHSGNNSNATGANSSRPAPREENGHFANKLPPSKPANGHHHHHHHHHQHNHQHQQSSQSSSSSSYSSSQHHNQAASKSSKSRLTNGNNNNNHSQFQQQTSSSSSSRTHDSPPTLMNQQQLEQVTTNESYVSVLNHCFDDIEKFIIRLQHAAAAARELQSKRKLSKRSSVSSQLNGHHHQHHPLSKQLVVPAGPLPLPGHQMSASEMAHLSSKARGPAEDDYFEILSKFKLAFNLLAKLKGCIHEPNAPELVHFLFTPLAIIIESARNVTPPIDPTLVGIPYLNKDALELLSNCCTSKESDMWLSLGPNWTQTIDINLLKASRLPSSFQPIFSDGWAPIITELELIGLVRPHQQVGAPVAGTTPAITNGTNSMPADLNHHPHPHHHHHHHQDNNSRRASKSHNEPEASVDVMDASGHYATGRNGQRSLHDSLGSSGARMNGQRSVGKHRNATSPPPMGAGPYGSGAYGPPSTLPDQLVAAPPFDDSQLVVDSHGYRVPSSYLSARYGPGVAPTSGRSKPISRRSTDAGGGLSSSSMIEPHLSEHQLMMDGYLATGDGYPNGAELLASDDYTELHSGPPDYYSGGGGGGGGHLLDQPGPSHYRRPRQPLNPRYSLPDNIGRPRRSTSKTAGGYLKPLVAGADHQQQLAAPYELQPNSFVNNHHGGLHDNHHHQLEENERQAMLADLGPAQMDWLLELQARQALIVRVLFTREANNEKELSVRQGEILEILDDSRKWWRARNIDLQVAHVPHTIVAVIEHYQTLDELLTNCPPGGGGGGGGGGAGEENDHHHNHYRNGHNHQAAFVNHKSAHLHQRIPGNRRLPAPDQATTQQVTEFNQNYGRKEGKRNSKTAGAFRYF